MGLFRKQMTNLELVVANVHNLWKKRTFRIINEEQLLVKGDLSIPQGKILAAVIPIYYLQVIAKTRFKEGKKPSLSKENAP